RVGLPEPGGVSVELLGEAVEDIDELGQALGLLGFSLPHPVGYASFDVVLENGEADTVERRFRRCELLQDLHAQPGFLDHPADAANLPLDPVEARDERLLLQFVEHVACLYCGGAWSVDVAGK